MSFTGLRARHALIRLGGSATKQNKDTLSIACAYAVVIVKSTCLRVGTFKLDLRLGLIFLVQARHMANLSDRVSIISSSSVVYGVLLKNALAVAVGICVY